MMQEIWLLKDLFLIAAGGAFLTQIQMFQCRKCRWNKVFYSCDFGS